MMSKVVKSVLFALMLTLGTSISLSGCGHPERSERRSVNSEPVNISFIVGVADNETKFNVKITEYASLPTRPGSEYAFTSVEGVPKVIIKANSIPDLSDRGYTKVMMERAHAGILADLTKHLQAYEPSSPEINLAAATELAVRNLKAHATAGCRNLLVFYCSGKSTTGLINMTETPLYKLDIKNSVDSVLKQMNVDMSGIDVVWYCIGDFGPAQADITQNEKRSLKDFYKMLFIALGANSVTFMDEPPINEYYHFPNAPVSSMAVEGTKSQLKELVSLNPETLLANREDIFEDPIAIPEDLVRFVPDKADFLDIKAAEHAVMPIAEYMNRNGSASILLYGTCAGDKETDASLRLGKARAEAVKTLLVGFGVEAERVKAVGVAPKNDPYYQFGLGTGAEGGINRKVVLVDRNTDLAKHILSCTREK